MKVRNGFVSNSSSSSFSCEVCGNEVSGWDLGLSEAEMCECINGHVFCEEHVGELKHTGVEETRKYCLENVDEDEYSKEEILNMEEDELLDLAKDYDYYEEERYDFPASLCPICTFSEVSTLEAYKFLLKRIGLTEAQLLKDMREQFEDYDKFLQFIKE